MQVGPFHITYCTNVHPGESLEEVSRVLTNDVSAVQAEFKDRPFGAGLRLGNSVVRTLENSPDKMSEFTDRCRSLQYSIFTVNGFPYGNFDQGQIKEKVYAPGWEDEARVEYTLALARVLAALPGPDARSISTVAGGFGPDTRDPMVRQLIAQNLVRAAEGLANLADETGIQIRLCLEPEPWTMLETTDDVLNFWARYLNGSNPVVGAHLGLCYDCCHQALHFEDPKVALTALESAGIAIGKIQVSSALHLSNPGDPDARRALMSFAEPRFLHQVVAKTGDGLLKALDLPQVDLSDERWLKAEAWRCHFHVPIWWQGSDALGTTRDDWLAAVAAAQGLKHSPHLEIETYTWDVIPEAEREMMAGGVLTDSILSEYRALIEALGLGD